MPGGRREIHPQVRAGHPGDDNHNGAMKIFYWVMGLLIVGTLLPSAVYLLAYAVTGAHEAANRARVLWNVSRVLALFGFNLLIWGHVIVGLWQIWFR